MSHEPHEWSLDTKAIHSGEPEPVLGAVSMPVFQSSTYIYEGESDYNSVRYIRLNNTPNQIVLGEKLAALEGGAAGTVSASGMAAISSALLTAVGEGEHLLIQENLYGGTFHFVAHHFAKMGRSFSTFAPDRPAEWAKLVTPKTRAIYVESLSNPMMRAPEFGALTRFAKERGLMTLIDNTFPSPVNFTPIAHGFDLVLHSATKYLNGHTDITAGAAIGSEEMIHKIIVLQNHLGGTLDPHACFLLQRGLKTLGVRVRQQNESAMQLAGFLAAHPRVKEVLYPGLPSHPQHGHIKDHFRGFGGMLSFVYRGTVTELDRGLKAMKLAYYAPSLGGAETLITRPRTTSHAGLPEAEARRLGIVDELVRVSVGLEDPADLIRDFAQALG